MKVFLHHLFIPRSSNNHRAKLLHHQSLLWVILFLLVGQFFLRGVAPQMRGVLGAATDLSANELLLLTNQKRQAVGLKPLVLQDKLAVAAKEKGENMFALNYWAHVAPDGTQPWYFFNKAGYDYEY